MREVFGKPDHPNLQLAIDAYLGEADRRATILGVSGESLREMSLASLLAPPHPGLAASEGPVEYANVHLAGGEILPCVVRGLYLVEDGARRHALLVSSEIMFPPRTRSAGGGSSSSTAAASPCAPTASTI